VIEASVGTTVHKFKTSFEQLLGIGNNADHKASAALREIDELKTKDAIPQAIQDAVGVIAKWCNSKLP